MEPATGKKLGSMAATRSVAQKEVLSQHRPAMTLSLCLEVTQRCVFLWKEHGALAM